MPSQWKKIFSFLNISLINIKKNMLVIVCIFGLPRVVSVRSEVCAGLGEE